MKMPASLPHSLLPALVMAAGPAPVEELLWETTGADAVEMESEIIRAICRAHSIPSATIRVISDAANENLPVDFNVFMTSEQKLNYAKLVLSLLTSPAKIPAMLRLQRQTQLAARNLAGVLSRVVPI